jgi:hypothetical protein
MFYRFSQTTNERKFGFCGRKERKLRKRITEKIKSNRRMGEKTDKR